MRDTVFEKIIMPEETALLYALKLLFLQKFGEEILSLRTTTDTFLHAPGSASNLNVMCDHRATEGEYHPSASFHDECVL